MKKIISRCPVCNHELKVTRLQCSECQTVIENDFALSKFDYLSDEELFLQRHLLNAAATSKKLKKNWGSPIPPCAPNWTA